MAQFWRMTMEEIWKYWYSYDTLFLWSSFISYFCNFFLPMLLEKEGRAKWLKLFLYLVCEVCTLGFLVFYLCFEHLSPSVHYQNGLKFYRGDVFSVDIETAIKAFEKSANKNNIEACRMLGEIYTVRGEIYIAIQWLKKGINLGDTKSAKTLAELYTDNIFVALSEQERKESAYLAYAQALCLGDTSVHQRMGELQAQIPQSIQGEANSNCKKLKRFLGR